MTIFDLFATADQIKIDSHSVNIPQVTSVSVFNGVISGIYVIVGVVAVIIIILSSFTFASGSYDPAVIAKAKNTILYSVVGLIVVIIAFVITQFILGGWINK
jgi:heme O synthase-like polyprenyltransferase